MTPAVTITIQLVLLGATAVLAFLATLSARRAASFDVTRDFDALAATVARMQSVFRSAQMQRVRAAALEPKPPEQPAAAPADLAYTPMPKDQLRALLRAKPGGTS